MPIIQAVNISKIFNLGQHNQVRALKNVNLSIESGQCVLLSGPSGSGKSTLLSILACLSKPTEGAYFCMGEQVSRWSEKFLTQFRRQHIGIIFQHFHLISGLTARANVAIPLVPRNFSHYALKQAIEVAADAAGIIHKIDEPVEKLSGGEQQRVAIARALVSNPELLFADEPTAHLDSHTALNILNTLQKLKNQGKTIVITSHDPLVQQHPMIDRHLRLQDGTLTDSL
ncbi:MAG: ABC transporter ATP-binding protein [Cytophagales bacterium]|nr:ABC transporter ATP-binding protein [Bernardetiaceae bacterium]MDW8209746.1 ABC transporter ATP-binding protein [Cytophagales bacterium]